jgi:Zn-dependent protease with chaperone function
MGGMSRVCLLLVLSLTTWSADLGCAAQGGARTVPESWIAANGGRSSDVAAACRLNRLCASLRPASLMTPHVLDSPEPAAYSWGNGEVFVTEGLLGLLDDAELAAAVAHEAGHLEGHARRAGVVSLQGHREGLSAEIEADEVGVGLLRDAGMAPQAMATMLTKVRRAANVRPVCLEDLDRRIEHVRDTVANN